MSNVCYSVSDKRNGEGRDGGTRWLILMKENIFKCGDASPTELTCFLLYLSLRLCLSFSVSCVVHFWIRRFSKSAVFRCTAQSALHTKHFFLSVGTTGNILEKGQSLPLTFLMPFGEWVLPTWLVSEQNFVRGVPISYPLCWLPPPLLYGVK